MENQLFLSNAYYPKNQYEYQMFQQIPIYNSYDINTNMSQFYLMQSIYNFNQKCQYGLENGLTKTGRPINEIHGGAKLMAMLSYIGNGVAIDGCNELINYGMMLGILYTKMFTPMNIIYPYY